MLNDKYLIILMDDLCNIVISVSQLARLYQPVDDIGEEVVVPQSVLGINLLVVNGQSPIQDASLLKETLSSLANKKSNLHIPLLGEHGIPWQIHQESSPLPICPW